MSGDEHTVAETPAASDTPPRAKVEAARKVIQKPGDLFDMAEGHLVAMRALGFREHVFDDDDGPVTVAEVAVVDLEGDEPRPLAVLEITWKRVIRQLRIAEPGSWQIGTLTEEPEYHAKELTPPGEDVDLDAIAEKLGRLQAASLTEPKQLQLEAGADPDDAIPF